MKVLIYDVVLPTDFRDTIKEEIENAMAAAEMLEESTHLRIDVRDHIQQKEFYFRLEDLDNFSESIIQFAGEDVACIKARIAGEYYYIENDPLVVEKFKEELND